MISPSELSHILYRLGEEDLPAGAVSPPIFHTSNFSFKTIASFQAAIADEKNKPIYSRGGNPTVRLLEKKLAALQGTEDALCFGSGSAAIAAAVTSSVKAGDHVITVDFVYSWTYKLLAHTLARFGVEFTAVNGEDNEAVKAALKPNTRLLILESPTSLNFKLVDLQTLIKWGKDNGLIVLCDNSFGSPINRKPVEFGADLICHSATKFIGGHSDVVAGVVCGNASLLREIFYGEYMTFGATLQAEQAWLLIRSLRTMPQRMQATAASAAKVVEFLLSHEKVNQVSWPFDPTNPGYELAKSQFDFTIPMFSFNLKTTDSNRIIRFCESLQTIRLAVSWGGFESLLLPAIIFPVTPHPANLMRLYVGLEDSEALISDLSAALEQC